jgi:hypothetical protein
MKKTIINFCLLIGSIIVAAGFGEILGRLYLSYQDRQLRQKRQENILTQVAKSDLFTRAQPGHFANKPNETVHWWGFDICTDSLGCRTGVLAPDSAKVILFIGDSMIFGLGLSDSTTIPSLLQRDLMAAYPDHPVKVINAGVIGYDFQQYLHQVERLVPRIKPDYILVGLCYNDLLPNEDPFGNVMAERGLNNQVANESEGKASFKKIIGLLDIKSMLRNSALYRIFNQTNFGSSLKNKQTVHSEPVVLASQKAAPELVDKFIETLQKFNVPSAFVYFPTPENLGQNNDLIYVKLLTAKGQAVLDMCRLTDLSVDDYFLREKDGRMQSDIHFNLKGSRVVANHLGDWLGKKWLAGKTHANVSYARLSQ